MFFISVFFYFLIYSEKFIAPSRGKWRRRATTMAFFRVSYYFLCASALKKSPNCSFEWKFSYIYFFFSVCLARLTFSWKFTLSKWKKCWSMLLCDEGSFHEFKYQAKWLLLFIARFIEDWFICGLKSMFHRCKTDKKIATRYKRSYINHWNISLYVCRAERSIRWNSARQRREIRVFPFPKVKRRRKSDIEKVLHAWGEREEKAQIESQQEATEDFSSFFLSHRISFLDELLLAGFLRKKRKTFLVYAFFAKACIMLLT